MRLLRLLQDAKATQPTTPVVLETLAHTLSVSPVRIRQLYKELAVEYQLPPLDTTSKMRAYKAATPPAIKPRLLELVHHLQTLEPKTPISLSKMARILGITRERTRQLYRQLAVEYQLPPVKPPGGGRTEAQIRELAVKRWAVEQQVKTLREKGLYNRQIARELGVSQHQVKTAITRLIHRGETLRRPPKLKTPTTSAFETAVCTYRSDGLSANQIAIKTGKPVQSVCSVFRRLHLPRLDRAAKTRSFEQQVRTYRAQGLSGPEIARQTGTSAQRIYAVLRKLQLPRLHTQTKRKA